MNFNLNQDVVEDPQDCFNQIYFWCCHCVFPFSRIQKTKSRIVNGCSRVKSGVLPCPLPMPRAGNSSAEEGRPPFSPTL